jgi:hypothetical protein
MDLRSLPSSLHSSGLFIPFVASSISSMFMWLLCTRGRLYWPVLSLVSSVAHITVLKLQGLKIYTPYGVTDFFW